MNHADSYKEDLVIAYDADAERRGAMTPARWRTDIVDAFAEDLNATNFETILELGCGTGQLARYLSDLDFTITAIDLSPANIEATRARDVHALVADFASLPFPDDSFDASLAVNSLIHVPPGELASVLIEIARVLRPGARFLMVVWGGITEEGFVDSEWLNPPRYFSSYSDEDLLALDTPGFKHTSFETVDIVEGDKSLRSQVLTLTAR
jgi:SAM-dependent methyltransferase